MGFRISGMGKQSSRCCEFVLKLSEYFEDLVECNVEREGINRETRWRMNELKCE
jgi:hypothetical protein